MTDLERKGPCKIFSNRIAFNHDLSTIIIRRTIMQYDNTRFPFHAYDRSCETRESRGRVRLPVTGYSIFQLGLRSCFFFPLLTRLNSNPATPGFSILVSRIWNIIRRCLKVGRENSRIVTRLMKATTRYLYFLRYLSLRRP